ncbi:hypothetical protein, partial [Streptococcus suis]|uniref:hypothetical protein n=1 Tax=Streptococcus suis TaxID=1307 RepID=UPI001C5584F0
ALKQPFFSKNSKKTNTKTMFVCNLKGPKWSFLFPFIFRKTRKVLRQFPKNYIKKMIKNTIKNLTKISGGGV